MTAGGADHSGALEAALGHRFSDPALLRQALTHRSLEGKPSYERLEFLGDRVLGLTVAEMLYTTYPDEVEGALARRHAALVRQDTVARVAERLGLDRHMELAPGEADLGSQSNPSLLCDVGEAVIGALYLDAGWDKARAFVRDQWKPLMAEDLTPPKDAKTGLQEWAQARGLPLPRYHIVNRDGPAHKPVFTISVTVEGQGSEQATGTSKRLAEQTAAAALLTRLDSQ